MSSDRVNTMNNCSHCDELFECGLGWPWVRWDGKRLFTVEVDHLGVLKGSLGSLEPLWVLKGSLGSIRSFSVFKGSLGAIGPFGVLKWSLGSRGPFKVLEGSSGSFGREAIEGGGVWRISVICWWCHVDLLVFSGIDRDPFKLVRRIQRHPRLFLSSQLKDRSNLGFFQETFRNQCWDHLD